MGDLVEPPIRCPKVRGYYCTRYWSHTATYGSPCALRPRLWMKLVLLLTSED